jgi:histidine triad (HIT) family protein
VINRWEEIMAKQQNPPVVDALQKAAKGLVYTSETEGQFEAFLWQDGGKLTSKHLLELAGAEAGTNVEESTLDEFLHAVPPEDRPGFNKLVQTINQQLSGVKVYKIGDEAEKEAYIVGKTSDGHWAGLKTTVVET